MESTDLGVPTGARDVVEEKDQTVNGHKEGLALRCLFCKIRLFKITSQEREGKERSQRCKKRMG